MSAKDWNSVVLPDAWSLEVIDEIDSTNDECKRRGHRNHGAVLVAEAQSAGRGRRGAEWLVEKGDGLTFSIVLKPSVSRAHWPRLSLAAGLAVTEAVQRQGVNAEVKWPNDVLVNGRKLCGILVEACEEVAIIGIGINVGTREFPPELDGVATSLWLEGLYSATLQEVLSAVLREFAGWSEEIGDGFPMLLERIRERCVLTGRKVTLRTAEGPLNGVVQGIGDKGELVLETAQGVRHLIQADEVRML